MITTGNLLDIVHSINKKHGLDCPVVLQVYDSKDNLLHGEYCLGYGIRGDGTLYLFTKPNDEIKERKG